MITPQQQTQILTNLGISALNPMQEAALNAITQDNDTFLIAPTGSGKTVGFLLPILNLLKSDQKTSVQCLVLAPSRELAIQIEQVWKKMATGFKVNVCYGGHPVETEIKNLSNPPALLIGTPGRIADHITRRSFSLDGIHTLVLDEFDKSLALGFHDEMEFIVRGLRNLRKRVLVSATSGISIPAFIRLNMPTTLTFTAEKSEETGLTTKVVYAQSKDKIDTLFDLLCALDSESALIFLNHREAAERTSELLAERGIHSLVYHGGMEQVDRERALIQFRNGSTRYLVTTDLAARGLDIPEMKYVIHYHLPLQAHEFTHRNGRTARMHASGTAYVILSPDETRPVYLDPSLEEFRVPAGNALPKPPDFVTLYISGGKKNKLNKVDIVGFFSQKGGLEKGDLGRIDVQDFISFAAVKQDKVKGLLAKISQEKMKGKKYKIEVAR
ncbi:DEAD/DEAH box helicase [Spirosoma linguale]|uniref:DEAD/DEAH box helicase domain protein n=1 Tax=Spirosoma linguale (strain ATCC 33905 / DSM 74 / LMG 10896 / Claus 1) TaxID=504472 RepID=D2QNF2_SPILD|nr:DEAD/DEAH box helicase domain protein [Spirosoma linguale DSM 74]